MLKTLVIFLLVTLPLSLFAHPGHDKIPGTQMAPHGGILKGTDEFYVEILSKKDALTVYIFDHDMKPIETSKVKLEGKAEFPRGKGSQTISWTADKTSYGAKLDPKGSHRYKLSLKLSHESKTEEISFQIEPKN